MYFKNFPLITYLYKVGTVDKLLVVKDITLNIRIRKEILNNVSIYEDFDITDGDTPERIADRVYGNATYHWLIMLCNDRFDYANDFPLSQAQLQEYVDIKYGVGNADTQHMLFGKMHFETSEGKVVDADHPFATPISNYEYEFAENERKRRIRLIHPKLVDRIVMEIENIFESAGNEQ